MRVVIWHLAAFQVALWRPAILLALTGAFSRQDSLAVCKWPSTVEGVDSNSQVIEWEDTRGIGSVNRSRASNVALIAGWQLPAGWQLRIHNRESQVGNRVNTDRPRLPKPDCSRKYSRNRCRSVPLVSNPSCCKTEGAVWLRKGANSVRIGTPRLLRLSRHGPLPKIPGTRSRRSGKSRQSGSGS